MQTYGQAGRQVGMQAGRQADTQTDTQTHRQRQRQTQTQTQRQTDRQVELEREVNLSSFMRCTQLNAPCTGLWHGDLQERMRRCFGLFLSTAVMTHRAPSPM